MGRFFWCDIKRIFSSRRTVVLCLLIPFLVMLLFESVVFPLLVTRTRVSASCFAVCNMDGTEVTKQFVNDVANSKSFKNIVYISTVNSMQEGLNQVDNGEVSGLLYVPPNFYADMNDGKNVKLEIYGNRFHTLECSLVLVSVEAALNTVGRAQNALNMVKSKEISLGAEKKDAEVFYHDLLTIGINVVTNRRAVLGESGFVSLAGGYLPVEVDISAMLAWFIALAALPLACFSASDFSKSVLQRGMRTVRMRMNFLTARLLSGALFILLVTFLIFPIGLGASSLDRSLSGNTAALFAAMGLIALCFSALAMGLSSWMPNGDAAVWTGFWIIVIFAMIGGAIMPESTLPIWVKSIGLWSPVRASMHLLAGTVFNFNDLSFRVDMFKMGLWGIVGVAATAAGFMRRSAT